MNKEDQTMDNFSGFLDSGDSDEDFFAAATAEEEGEEYEPEEKEEPNDLGDDPEGSEEPKEKKKKAVKPEEDFFAEAEKEEEEEEEENNEEEEDSKNKNTSESLATFNFLRSKGLIKHEDKEGEKITEAKAEEILEDSLDTLFEERLEEFFSDVPDIVKQMNKFVLKGGDINEYLKTVSIQNTTGIEKGMDLEDESNQEKITRHGLEEEGYDKEYIDAQIDFLKDSKRLESISKTHYKKWETKHRQEEENILKSKEKEQLKEKEDRRALKGKVTDFLDSVEEVTGFTVSTNDKKELPNYMSDRTVKLDNGNQITGMQRDLMRVLNSPTGSVQMAKLLKAANKEGVLDFKDIQRNSETKVTKKVKDNVRRNKNSIQNSESRYSKKKSLADYFND